MSREKRSDQEWIDLILDYSASPLRASDWSAEHGISLKALHYHMSRLRSKGHQLPGKAPIYARPKKQEVVCLEYGAPNPARNLRAVCPSHPEPQPLAIRIDFHGIYIDIANHASPETIAAVLHAWEGLC